MSLTSRILGRYWRLPPARTHRLTIERGLSIPMRDGVTLLADRYYPRGGERLPVVLIRSPYGRSDLFELVSTLLSERGLQVLLESCRGTGGSGGVLYPFFAEEHDGCDTIAWLESYLVRYRGAVLVVSHDRAFLDNVCPETIELGSKGVRVYPHKYSDYALLREEDLARERANAPDPFQYYVQAGAFRSAEEAEALRAKLSLAGYDPKVSIREVAGRQLHRVRIGPIETKTQAEEIQQKLSASKMASALVRVQR